MAINSQLAFFSYSREDSAFALRLAADLKASGAIVWLDQLDIAAGAQWDRAVEDALSASVIILVILSPTSVSSANVLDEIAFALGEHKTVIPILYRDCSIPLRLRRLQHLDFRQDYALGLGQLTKTLISCQQADGLTTGSSAARVEGQRQLEGDGPPPQKHQVEAHAREAPRLTADAEQRPLAVARVESASHSRVESNEPTTSGTTARKVDAESVRSTTDVLERLLAYGPDFFDRSMRLLTRPKTFLLNVSASKQAVQQAVVFFLCYITFAFILEWPLLQVKPSSIPIALIVSLLFHVSLTAIMAAVTRLAFRAVRGQASFEKFLVVTMYINAISSAIWVLGAPVSKGLVMSSRPELYPQFKVLMDEFLALDFFAIGPAQWGLLENTTILAAFLAWTLLLLVGGVWIVATWGAFRQIAEVSRARSFAAFCLLQVLGAPLAYLFGTAQRALGINLF